MSFVDFFPTEMTEMVFSHLPVPDLVNSSLVCVSWFEASNTSNIWKAAIKRSIPRDRFKIVSNLDRFTGIASNYDDNHRFQVDRQSPSNLSPMNPWKLSLCQNNFVRSNWHGSNNTSLARHQIKFEGDVLADSPLVVYPSKSPQDRIYLPIVVGNKNGQEMDFFLIRLDGTPRIDRKILSTGRNAYYIIRIVCIDRDCIVWVEGGNVKYLSLSENKDNSQIEDLGKLACSYMYMVMVFMNPHSRSCEMKRNSNYMLAMDANYIVAGFRESYVKIWCKKTKQLKQTLKSENDLFDGLNSFYLYNERIYLNRSGGHHGKESFLEIYDIKKDKSLEIFTFANDVNSTDFDRALFFITFNDKYYALLNELDADDFCEIDVRDIETNEVKISVNVNDPHNYKDGCITWIVDDKLFYIEQHKLEILSLVNHEYISHGINFPTPETITTVYDIWDSFLLSRDGNFVRIWDWKLDRKLHELQLMPAEEHTESFYNDETRLVAFGDNCVQVIGFW